MEWAVLESEQFKAVVNKTDVELYENLKWKTQQEITHRKHMANLRSLFLAVFQPKMYLAQDLMTTI